jgi:hypothetical protein
MKATKKYYVKTVRFIRNIKKFFCSGKGIMVILLLVLGVVCRACVSCSRWQADYEKTAPHILMPAEARAAVTAIAGKSPDVFQIDSFGLYGGEPPLFGHPEFFACRTGDVSMFLFRTPQDGQYKFYRVCCRMVDKKATCTVQQ